MKAVCLLVGLLWIEGLLSNNLVRAASDHDDRRNNIVGILDKIQQDLADKLKIHHHIPAPDTDQCADSRLGLLHLERKQPYNAKSASCLIQDALSSNPIGCKKINGVNGTLTAVECGINTAHPNQPAWATDFIRNNSAAVTRNFLVKPPMPPGPTQRRRLQSTEVDAEPLGQLVTSSGTIITTSGTTMYFNPNGTTLNAGDFYQYFAEYYASFYTQMIITPGTYTVEGDFFGFHLICSCNGVNRFAAGWGQFDLDFQGSTLILPDGTAGGLFFSYCDGLLVHNATAYYEFSVNPWYQATVTDMSSNGQVWNITNSRYQATSAEMSARGEVWNITVQDGYPTTYVTNNYQALCVPWDPVTRLPLQNTSDIYPTPGQTVALGGSRFRFNFDYDNFGVSIGDYITCRGNQGNHGLISWYSQNTILQDMTFYNAAVYGIYEETGTNNSYINNQIIPYPYPVGSGGANQAPLQSSTADAFHASTSFVGPTLINNTFLNSGDDGIAIHGRYYLVVAVDPVGGNITVATGCTYDCARLYQGTSLTGYTNATQFLGTTSILAVTAVPDPLPPGSVSVTQPSINLNGGTNYLNLTVACWPSKFNLLAFDSWVTSKSNEGDGFSVVNNTVGYNRGRGILLKASNGIVTGNFFIKPKFIAAQITPETYWQESDFSSNIIVSNNLFDSYYGGITLGQLMSGTYLPGQFQNHINVTITGNIIRDAADQPLLITSATNVTVTNNLFDRVLCYPFSYGAAQVFVPTPQPPIFIAYASNLLIANNTYNIPANCTYGNWAQPIQTMNGTVTGLVTSP